MREAADPKDNSASPRESSVLMVQALRQNVASVLKGKSAVIDLVLAGFLARGHLLLEDVPGVGKTLLGRALAGSIAGQFKRIQFTPDLLPSDITGVSIYEASHQEFRFVPGPVFAQIVLADEINRATPRTQAALLEAMGEGQLSVDGVTRPLPQPFLVIATQNPVEYQGTYPLPEAQLDRFALCLQMGYPDRSSELAMIFEPPQTSSLSALRPVISPDQMRYLQAQVAGVHLERSLADYVLDIVAATRSHKTLKLGASPRGTLSLVQVAKAWALTHGRDYVVPDDIRMLVGPVLGHRILPQVPMSLTDPRRAEILNSILNSIQVPPVNLSGPNYSTPFYRG
ncbi:MoxR family ATPase [Leptolyngbya sp. FACHB-261]|uniref:AAA family ATPase n=1 Tax=Leptolyngbya sp. FACHB-261 TaxID=2692806 RepID=UPI001689716B|nr:MoxR family ATPase [Leptolyngbya sp. FACHB-261]MBD2104815.1 MoxR family ATPase [Leptolyngbya sp. FACHB-261]